MASLAEYIQQVEKLKRELDFDNDPDCKYGMSCRMEVNVIQARAYMELAQCALQLADYHRMQGQ